MKKYNRTLDFTLLALNQLRLGKTEHAARLLAKAGEQRDLKAAIQILEASNKAAQQYERVEASKRLTASEDEFPFESGQGEGELAADLAEEFENDPLDDISDNDLVLESEVADDYEVDAADIDEDDEDGEDDVEDDEDDEEEVSASKRSAAKVRASKKEPAAVAMARVLAQLKRKVR